MTSIAPSKLKREMLRYSELRKQRDFLVAALRKAEEVLADAEYGNPSGAAIHHAKIVVQEAILLAEQNPL